MRYNYIMGFMIIGLALATLLPISCSQNDEPPVMPISTAVQVELSAQIGKNQSGKTISRALTRVVGNQWELNDIVGMFMITNGGALPGDLVPAGAGFYNNRRYKIEEGEGSSGFKLTAATQADAMYYPDNGGIVDFIAYYPYEKTLNNYSYPLDIKFQGGSKNHDLLYSTDATGSKSSADGHITFQHQLSKLIVKLKTKNWLIDFSKMTGNIAGVPVTGKFSLIDAQITNTALGTLEATKNYSQDSGEDFPEGGDIMYTCFDIILIPHAATNGRELSFTSSSKRYYWLLPGDLDFESGKEYEVVLEVDGSELNPVSFIVKDWNDGQETMSIPVVKIPAGTFMMGSPDGMTAITFGGNTFTPDADPMRVIDIHTNIESEQIHKVTIQQAFYMSKYEITTTQFSIFLNDNSDVITVKQNGSYWEAWSTMPATGDYGESDYILPGDIINGEVRLARSHNWGITYDDHTNRWSPQLGYENHPVNQTTWYGALTFARWVGGRLPTEAEWEYACRGGDYFFGKTTYRWASFHAQTLSDYAWYAGNRTQDIGTRVIGQKLPNAWGLHDMHGNAWEWCYDWYSETFYGSAAVTDPVNTTLATHRVSRGGNFDSSADLCRSANRYTEASTGNNAFRSFRVAFPL